MVNKKLALFALLICVIFMLSGCWDAMDVNDKTLVTLVVTDRRDDEFAFYIEIPNLSLDQGQNGGSQEQYQIRIGRGKTYTEARRNLNSKMDTPIFLGTVGSMILTHELAEYGIQEYMFRMQHMVDYRKVLNVVTTFEEPEDLLKAEPVNNQALGYSIEDNIKSVVEVGSAIAYTASDILEFIYAGYCYVLYNIDLRDGDITHTGYSIMHNDMFLDFIPLEESNGLIWLLGEKIRLVYAVPFDNSQATVEVKLKKKKVTPYYTDGKVSFHIDISFSSQVMYLNHNIKFDENARASVEKLLEGMILEDIANTIDQSKQVQCDYLGFLEHFRIKYPDAAKTIAWPKAYVASDITLAIDSQLDPGGLMDYEVQSEENEANR